MSDPVNDRWSWIVGFHDQRFLISTAVASQSSRDAGGDGMGRTALMLDETAVVAARELARREYLLGKAVSRTRAARDADRG